MPLKTQMDEPPSLNLTSMIDVAFLLVIFFMLGTRFTSTEQKIDVKIPKVGNVNGLPNVAEKKAVNILRDGRIAFGGDFVTETELTSRLTTERKRNPKMGVVVRGDAEVPLQRFAGVLSACRQSGVTDIGVSVKPARRE